MKEKNWHIKQLDELYCSLAVHPENGLSDDEAAIRLREYGPNELQEQGSRSPWQILLEQITSTMSLILAAAAVISGLAGSFKDSATILSIVILFALLGFFQDFRAERAIAALRRLSVPISRVRRGGSILEINSYNIVPGDIILLEAGSIVPADCRIMEAHALRLQESLLTGEPEAAEKNALPLTSPEIPVADRKNMLFMGTMVSAGRGVALVVATGMSTELGNIAAMLQQVGQEWTPLQKRLDRLGKILAAASVGIATLIFVAGILRGESLKDMLLLSVSVAVAAIPEGLPAVVTITLALGAQRMLRRNALIRRLPAVETLGSVTVICSDKTGTLTQNRMTVTGLLTIDEIPDSHGTPVKGQGQDTSLLLVAGALCNDAVIRLENGAEELLGDPTEGALVSAASAAGFFRQELEQSLPRIAEIPFDSTTRRMITVHSIYSPFPFPLPPPCPSSGKLLLAKGALDSLLSICAHALVDGKPAPLSTSLRSSIQQSADRLSGQGQRVLAFAYRLLGEDEDDRLEALQADFICIGLAAMTDPPRQEAADAVKLCLSAGIRPVMITGDHPLTAVAIAAQVGIDASSGALTGQELDRLPPEQFDEKVNSVSVYARVTPEHKLKIVDSIQRQGGVAAMTGDGVNDAPALKKADVGVAMGKAGTDVARESSDMVLMDDNFATIVAAVEEGRTIYDNIRKFVVFSVAGNTGKILAVFLLPFLGFPMPLTPLQLLWLNLLTDGLLGLGMGVERPEPDIMKRPPIASDSQIFDSHTVRYVLLTGALIGISTMAVTWMVRESGGPWQTVLFASLAIAQVAQAMSLRSFRSSFIQMGLFTNPVLLAMAASVVILQGMAVYLSPLQQFFKTSSMGPQLLVFSFIPAVAVFVLLEAEKFVGRLRRRKQGQTLCLP